MNREKDRLEAHDQITLKKNEYEKYVKLIEDRAVYDLPGLKERESILSKEIIGGNDKISELEEIKEILNKKQIKMEILRSNIDNMLKNLNIKQYMPINNSIIKNMINEFDSKTGSIKSIEEKISTMKSKIFYPMIDWAYGSVDEKYKEAKKKDRNLLFAGTKRWRRWSFRIMIEKYHAFL